MHVLLQLVGCAGMVRHGGYGREVIEPMPYFRSWEASHNGLQQTCHSGGEVRHEGVMCWCECCAAWQTDETTPLFIASCNGHVECVRALLGGGAAINQAKVGCTGSMARHCGGLCVRGRVGDCVHACVCSLLGALGCYALEGMGERRWSPCRASSHGKHHDNGLRQTCSMRW